MTVRRKGHPAVSMLTPPGLKGKQYRITGTAYPRLRRPHQRRRRILLGIAGVLALSVLAWGTVQLVGIFAGGRRATAGSARCVHAASGDAADSMSAPSGAASAGPRASVSAGASAGAGAGPGAKAGAKASAAAVTGPGAGITVNVYNATDQAGLAGRTAALLKQRGFTIGTVANAPAPLQNKIAGPAQVTGGAAGARAMVVLGSEVTGAKRLTDTRKDGSVDLVLGNTFTALATPAQAAQALTLASKPTPAASARC